ncbi:biotin--[acetyl-CoA-carboxylase] ligase [Paracidovorax citrulli]
MSPAQSPLFPTSPPSDAPQPGGQLPQWRIDAAVLAGLLEEPARRWQIELVEETGSTNADLVQHCRQSGWDADDRAVVARLAYRQTAGRGRQGRPWQGQAGMTFSVAMPLPLPPARLAGLSLAVGLAVAQALECCDPAASRAVRLKWPNDLQIDERKLAGILIETVPAARVPAAPAASASPGLWAVVGIGLNLVRDPAMEAALGRELAGVAECWGGFDAAHGPTRLFAAVLNRLAAMRTDFIVDGFAPLSARWTERDAYRDQPVRLLHDGALLAEGLARGVDSDGHLLLETPEGLQRIATGELSLRPARGGPAR